MTRKRWPDGVTGTTVFFEKNVPRGTPDWIRTGHSGLPGSSKDRERVTYPIIEDRAGLAWVANLAALELHVPQWQVGPRGGVRNPDRLVIDLDPGPPAGLTSARRLRYWSRATERRAHDPVPVTSGSKACSCTRP
jgi:bifunctional non-homologous end joining protein LigD